jgi:hypothetical protein
MATKETRRGFLRGMVTVVGGVAAGTLSGLGCSAPGSSPTATESIGPAGATEVLSLSRGLRFSNVMPDHVAAVRVAPTAIRTPASFTSKGFEKP